MSEYWKSTPKYWCKFCKTYVRDTKYEKQQHDATPRHQSSIQRSLRTLHREHEREDRDKQRAKDEVARLNGLVSANGTSSGSKLFSAQSIAPATVAPKQASAEDRKRQMKQLAEMGVEIPKEHRSDYALAGQWETVGQRSAGRTSIKEEEDVKSGELSFGVRKRKHEGAEEEEEAGQTVVRKGWGSTIRRYPGEEQGSEDIAALFKVGSSETRTVASHGSVPTIKREESQTHVHGVGEEGSAVAVKSEDTAEGEPSVATAGIVFKKRKAKVTKAS